MELLVGHLTEVRLAEEVLHYVQTVFYLPCVLQRKDYPALQHTSAHRRYGAVDDVEQRRPVLLHGVQKLERAYGELVEPHIPLLLYACERRDVRDVRVLGHLEILQDDARGNHPTVQMLNAETLQRVCAEVAQQLLPCALLGEHPLVQLEHTPSCAEPLFELLTARLLVEHLLGLETAEQFLHIVGRTLAGEELAGGYIEKRHTACRPSEVHGRQEVVLLIVQHIVAHCHAGSHQFGDTALHESLRKFGIFQLVAYSHASARPY